VPKARARPAMTIHSLHRGQFFGEDNIKTVDNCLFLSFVQNTFREDSAAVTRFYRPKPA
jgi:hypothetical protein